MIYYSMITSDFKGLQEQDVFYKGNSKSLPTIYAALAKRQDFISRPDAVFDSTRVQGARSDAHQLFKQYDREK